MTKTSEYYAQAIGVLETYREHEPNGNKRQVATSKINALLLAQEAKAFDELAGRSDALRKAVAALQSTIDGASDDPGVSNALGRASTLIQDIKAQLPGE